MYASSVPFRKVEAIRMVADLPVCILARKMAEAVYHGSCCPEYGSSDLALWQLSLDFCILLRIIQRVVNESQIYSTHPSPSIQTHLSIPFRASSPQSPFQSPTPRPTIHSPAPTQPYPFNPKLPSLGPTPSPRSNPRGGPGLGIPLLPCPASGTTRTGSYLRSASTFLRVSITVALFLASSRSRFLLCCCLLFLAGRSFFLRLFGLGLLHFLLFLCLLICVFCAYVVGINLVMTALLISIPVLVLVRARALLLDVKLAGALHDIIS